MNTKTVALILMLAATGGCATIQKHPILTAVAVGIAAGSIAASDSHRTEQPRVGITRPDCTHGACQ